MLVPLTRFLHRRAVVSDVFSIVAQAVAFGRSFLNTLPMRNADFVPCRACEMADEFPHVQVIGVDVAPIQPEYAGSA